MNLNSFAIENPGIYIEMCTRTSIKRDFKFDENFASEFFEGDSL